MAIDQPGDVQHRKSNDLAPRERVAHAAIERVGPIFREPNDVGRGSTPGSRPRQAGDSGADQHGAEPQRHPAIETAFEQIEGQRPGRDEEHPDPDRPVREAVADLVALADAADRWPARPAGHGRCWRSYEGGKQRPAQRRCRSPAVELCDARSVVTTRSPDPGTPTDASPSCCRDLRFAVRMLVERPVVHARRGARARARHRRECDRLHLRQRRAHARPAVPRPRSDRASERAT